MFVKAHRRMDNIILLIDEGMAMKALVLISSDDR